MLKKLQSYLQNLREDAQGSIKNGYLGSQIASDESVKIDNQVNKQVCKRLQTPIAMQMMEKRASETKTNSNAKLSGVRPSGCSI